MAVFTQAYALTMNNEGGYANDPDDMGGETCMGIARNFWPEWPGWKIVDRVKDTHPANLNHALAANLSLNAMVHAFYKEHFWDCLELDLLQCQQTADQLFDVGVNMGTEVAAKFLQEAVNVFHKPALVVDGKVGTQTIAAANALVHEKIYDQINTLRKQCYDQIIDHDPADDKFEHSWFSRIKPFQPDNDQNTP